MYTRASSYQIVQLSTYELVLLINMLLYTHIGRVKDSLPLVASIESDDESKELRQLKSQINVLLGVVDTQSEPVGSISSGSYMINYSITDGIIYFTVTEGKFPKQIAFSYLEDLQKEFGKSHGTAALQAGVRPYQFAEFDNYIQKTKRVYQDQRATKNLDRINSDLKDVSKIMSKNIEDLLYRGEKLDRMSDLSTSLKYESKKYMSAAKRVNLEALIRQYAPIAGIVFIIMFIIWWRLF